MTKTHPDLSDPESLYPRWPPETVENKPRHPRTPIQRASAFYMLAELRAAGWRVAVHNDYRVGGEDFTFWLLTRGCLCVRGEGPTDEEALAACVREVERLRLDPADSRDWQAVLAGRRAAVAAPGDVELDRCGKSRAPEGWSCTRAYGHDGPCAAVRDDA